MKPHQFIYILLFLFSGCQNTTKQKTTTDQTNNSAVANQFINAFYSFKKDSLQSMLSLAKVSQPSILYYQKWAECGHYQIVKRGGIIEKNDSLVIFPVTVQDDLMGALKINFNVTDTFKLSIKNGVILSVTTASNDIDTYFKAKEWVKLNRPDLVKKACEGIWEAGPTPCECVQGMVKGFADFQAKKN